MTNDARQDIDCFLKRNLSQWRGLAVAAPQDVEPYYPFLNGEGKESLGLQNVEYVFRSLRWPGFSEPIQFFFTAGQLGCIISEFWSFDRVECGKLLHDLAEPPERLDFYWRDGIIAQGEWVFHNRGISMGVIAETRLIAKVTVYPPCLLSVYCDKYYYAKLSREFDRN